MRKRSGACSLCKPHKKWEQRDARKTGTLKQSLLKECGVPIRLRILK